MHSWLSWLSEIFKDSDGHWNWIRIGAVLATAGAAIAAVTQGIWAVFIFLRKKPNDENRGGTSVALPGTGIASGGNTSVGGDFSVGPSKEQIEQIQKPLAEQLAAQNALIANLTKALVERNPSAGPGAEQAVGQAVQSIARGAEAGDSRLEQAFSLLKENKITEATQLLSAFAEDKEARAEQETGRAEKDRKEAAIAYRNLGAIGVLRDPTRALEAYERAVALNPDDLESLYWAGAIQIDYGDLNKAQARLERVLTLAKTDDQAFDKHWALVGLGDVKQRRGDLALALEYYRDGLAIIYSLAKSDPDNAGWQFDLGISTERIGDAQMEQNDLAGALKSYSDSLTIFKRLAKSDPGNALGRHHLSVSFGRLALVYRQSGNNAKALDALRQGQAIISRMTKLSPDNAEWKKDLAWFDGRIAELPEEWNLSRTP